VRFTSITPIRTQSELYEFKIPIRLSIPLRVSHHLLRKSPLLLPQHHCLLVLSIDQSTTNFILADNSSPASTPLQVLYLCLPFHARKRAIRRLKGDTVPILTLEFKVCVWPYQPCAFLKTRKAGKNQEEC
jgi:hypothetical protein